MPEIITKHDKPKRLITGWYTFDKAFQNFEGDIGFPLGKLTEVYGPNHCGKSTFCYAISGKIARQIGGNIDYKFAVLQIVFADLQEQTTKQWRALSSPKLV